MSGELNNNKEKNKDIDNKELDIIEKYQFKYEDSIELITDSPSESEINKKIEGDLIKDIPSKSLNKNSDKKKVVNIQDTIIKIENVDLPDIKSEKKIIVMKSNKELYESFIRDLKYYSLSINEDVIYNSSIDKSKECPVKFENNYFVLFGKKYSYNGLKIKKININK